MKKLRNVFLAGVTLFILYSYFTAQIQAENSEQHVITISSIGFSPATLQARVGDTVVFINKDAVPHWPASNIHPTHQIYPEFDPKEPIESNGSWNFQFNRGGIWKYHDHLLPQLTGTVEIIGNRINSSESPRATVSLKETIESVKQQFIILFYRLFPAATNQKLSTIKLQSITRNDKELRFWLSILGSNKTMEKLLNDTAGGNLVDCHQEAHAIGRLAFAMEGQSVFQKGSSACHSGFYHGAMEAFLQKNGTGDLGRKITTLCNLFPTQFENFECLHGVGHGVLAYDDYDLPKAIDTCHQLNDSFEQSSCYGGVFMENIITAKEKGAVIAHRTTWVNNDPHFPCSGLSDASYLIMEQCYLMQTSRMLDIFHYDFSKVIPECSNAPENMKETCFQSVGRDAAGQTLRKPDGIINICDQVPFTYRSVCIKGALFVIIDFWGNGIINQPHALCNALHTPDEKKYCYTLLGSRLIEIFEQKKDRTVRCNYAPSDYQNICLKAADVN